MGITNITGISDSRVAPICGEIIGATDRQVLIVAPTYIGARRLAQDVSFFTKKKVYLVPSDEELLKSYEAKNKDTLFGLLDVLRALTDGEECVVVAPASMAIKKLPPKEAFVERSLKLKVGGEIRLTDVLESLSDMGYERVPLVFGKGQFSLRGDILDIFTPYEDNPIRIDLFDTEIEDMRYFDSVSQRSIGRSCRPGFWCGTKRSLSGPPKTSAKPTGPCRREGTSFWNPSRPAPTSSSWTSTWIFSTTDHQVC